MKTSTRRSRIIGTTRPIIKEHSSNKSRVKTASYFTHLACKAAQHPWVILEVYRVTNYWPYHKMLRMITWCQNRVPVPRLRFYRQVIKAATWTCWTKHHCKKLKTWKANSTKINWHHTITLVTHRRKWGHLIWVRWRALNFGKLFRIRRKWVCKAWAGSHRHSFSSQHWTPSNYNKWNIKKQRRKTYNELNDYNNIILR